MARPVSKRGARKGAPKRKAPAAVKSAAKKAAPKKVAPPRRPPEVSAAKWASWSPGYQKRAAGFYAKHPGAPAYRMRGKGKGEHLTRKQRLEERMEALAERQSYRGGDKGARDADAIVKTYQAIVKAQGEKAFGQLERAIRDRKKGEGRITSAEFGWDWEYADYDGDDAELFYN